MKDGREQLRGFNENQDKMGLERFRLEQRIAGLRESFVNNRCPVSADAGEAALTKKKLHHSGEGASRHLCGCLIAPCR